MIRLLLTLLLLTGSTWATPITIGQVEYLSTVQGISGYKVTFNTTGVTAQPLTFANVTLSVRGRHESTGPISTATLPILFLGGPGHGLPACPCTSLRLQLVFPGNTPITFMLADGQVFATSHISVTLLSSSGTILMPAATASITLTPVPEPETWALMSIGLVAIWSCVRRGIGTKEKPC